MPNERTEPLFNTPRLDHLDPSTDHIPVEVFNRLVDVVNTLIDTVILYEAHSENLIERMARVDEHLWPEEWDDHVE